MCYERAVSLTWSCRLSVAEYAALGREAPAPREHCPRCARPMAFDGSYPRVEREAGTVHRIFVHRARCKPCGRSEALLTHFICRRRHDSVSSIGAAVLARHGVELQAGVCELYREVPSRTLRLARPTVAVPSCPLDPHSLEHPQHPSAGHAPHPAEHP